jgi:hypothetical protein
MVRRFKINNTLMRTVPVSDLHSTRRTRSFSIYGSARLRRSVITNFSVTHGLDDFHFNNRARPTTGLGEIPGRRSAPDPMKLESGIGGRRDANSPSVNIRSKRINITSFSIYSGWHGVDGTFRDAHDSGL